MVTINDLAGDTIENFAEELFQDWGIGKEKEDNGLLILIVKADRKMRIEVGYGLEGEITDARSNWIIEKTLKPAFQKDEYYQGLNQATDEIMAQLRGQNNLPELSVTGTDDYLSIFESSFSIIFGAGWILLAWLASILGRSKSWWFGRVLGAIIGVIIGFWLGITMGSIASLFLVPVGLLFDYIVSRSYRKAKSSGRYPWWIGGRGGGVLEDLVALGVVVLEAEDLVDLGKKEYPQGFSYKRIIDEKLK